MKEIVSQSVYVLQQLGSSNVRFNYSHKFGMKLKVAPVSNGKFMANEKITHDNYDSLSLRFTNKIVRFI